MTDFSPLRLPRWNLAASIGFLAGLIGISVVQQPSDKASLASGVAGAVVAIAVVELVALWRPRR